MGLFGFTTCMGKTRLTGGKATYSARVKHRSVIRGKDLVEGLAAETGYSTTVVGTVVEGLRNYLCKQLKAGNKIDFGAFSVGLSVRGSFPSANSPFDPNSNEVGVDVRAGVELRKAVKKLVPDNLMDVDGPRISGIISFAHQASSNYFKILRGDLCNMVGYNLGQAFTGDGDGLWLETREGKRVAELRVTEHDDGRINCVLEDSVPLGEYWLVIGCREPGRKEVFTGRRLVQVVSSLK